MRAVNRSGPSGSARLRSLEPLRRAAHFCVRRLLGKPMRQVRQSELPAAVDFRAHAIEAAGFLQVCDACPWSGRIT
jgi:hypothetical protein